MKKFLLGVGMICVTSLPVISAISCGSGNGSGSQDSITWQVDSLDSEQEYINSQVNNLTEAMTETFTTVNNVVVEDLSPWGIINYIVDPSYIYRVTAARDDSSMIGSLSISVESENSEVNTYRHSSATFNLNISLVSAIDNEQNNVNALTNIQMDQNHFNQLIQPIVINDSNKDSFGLSEMTINPLFTYTLHRTPEDYIFIEVSKNGTPSHVAPQLIFPNITPTLESLNDELSKLTPTNVITATPQLMHSSRYGSELITMLPGSDLDSDLATKLGIDWNALDHTYTHKISEATLVNNQLSLTFTVGKYELSVTSPTPVVFMLDTTAIDAINAEQVKANSIIAGGISMTDLAFADAKRITSEAQGWNRDYGYTITEENKSHFGLDALDIISGYTYYLYATGTNTVKIVVKSQDVVPTVVATTGTATLVQIHGELSKLHSTLPVTATSDDLRQFAPNTELSESLALMLGIDWNTLDHSYVHTIVRTTFSNGNLLVTFSISKDGNTDTGGSSFALAKSPSELLGIEQTAANNAIIGTGNRRTSNGDVDTPIHLSYQQWQELNIAPVAITNANKATFGLQSLIINPEYSYKLNPIVVNNVYQKVYITVSKINAPTITTTVTPVRRIVFVTNSPTQLDLLVDQQIAANKAIASGITLSYRHFTDMLTTPVDITNSNKAQYGLRSLTLNTSLYRYTMRSYGTNLVELTVTYKSSSTIINNRHTPVRGIATVTQPTDVDLLNDEQIKANNAAANKHGISFSQFYNAGSAPIEITNSNKDWFGFSNLVLNPGYTYMLSSTGDARSTATNDKFIKLTVTRPSVTATIQATNCPVSVDFASYNSEWNSVRPLINSAVDGMNDVLDQAIQNAQNGRVEITAENKDSFAMNNLVINPHWRYFVVINSRTSTGFRYSVELVPVIEDLPLK